MFDADGNLPAGLHDWTIAEVRARLVDEFPQSGTRGSIMDGLERLRGELLALSLEGDQLLDGSFATSKMDPRDVDVLTMVDKDLVDQLDASSQQTFQSLVDGAKTKSTHLCDSYFLPRVPANHPDSDQIRRLWKYWLGEFGFDRSNRPKGIVNTPLTPAVVAGAAAGGSTP